MHRYMYETRCHHGIPMGPCDTRQELELGQGNQSRGTVHIKTAILFTFSGHHASSRFTTLVLHSMAITGRRNLMWSCED